MNDIVDAIPYFLVFIVGGTCHEFCHAWTAYRLGDPTSREMGRMTLNPLVHIDPIGTILFPLINAMVGGVLIGWMRPVPVNPFNLLRGRRDMLLVSLAGPFANLFLAFLGFLVAYGFYWATGEIPIGINYWIILNLALAFFNLLPIPPLDGSSIVDYVRRDDSGWYHAQGFLGMMVLYMLLMIGGLEYLWIAASSTMAFMGSTWVFPALAFMALLLAGIIFYVKTSPRGRISARKKPKASKSAQTYETARMIGTKLQLGGVLTRSEAEWVEMIRLDRGNGENLCSPISFHGDNDFCAACPNLNRCALRLIESLQAENRGEQKT
jgi:hypothetical protein